MIRTTLKRQGDLLYTGTWYKVQNLAHHGSTSSTGKTNLGTMGSVMVRTYLVPHSLMIEGLPIYCLGNFFTLLLCGTLYLPGNA
jgi:hypothetical protein